MRFICWFSDRENSVCWIWVSPTSATAACCPPLRKTSSMPQTAKLRIRIPNRKNMKTLAIFERI